MKTIVDTDLIEKTVYELCLRANTKLPEDVYLSLKSIYEKQSDDNQKTTFGQILKNAYISNKNQRPLCQDTGQVVVFVKVGQEVSFQGKLLNDAINAAVSKAYKDFYFRKSVVYDALNRKNTNDNTPAIVHTEIVDGDCLKIDVLIKGAGSENMSAVKMLKPSDGVEGIIDFAKETVEKAGVSACPPMHLGVGVGGTIEKACILAKKALIKPCDDDSNKELEQNILDETNKLNSIFKVSVLTSSTHIACLPVCININCHSARHSSASIFTDKILYEKNDYIIEDLNLDFENYKKINTSDIKEIRNLQKGDEVLLSGTIYTARDMAHNRIFEDIKAGRKPPFEIKEAIVFYAGPCPEKEGEIIGPIGPTTSSRMDKFTPFFIKKGLLAMIGKGSRNKEVQEAVLQFKSPYFVATGGVASLLSKCVKKAEVVAYQDLGAEAIFKLEVKDLPLIVELA